MLDRGAFDTILTDAARARMRTAAEARCAPPGEPAAAKVVAVQRDGTAAACAPSPGRARIAHPPAVVIRDCMSMAGPTTPKSPATAERTAAVCNPAMFLEVGSQLVVGQGERLVHRPSTVNRHCPAGMSGNGP